MGYHVQHDRSIFANARGDSSLQSLVSLSVWCFVLCRRNPPSGPWDQAVFFLGPPGLGFLKGGLLASWRMKTAPPPRDKSPLRECRYELN